MTSDINLNLTYFPTSRIVKKIKNEDPKKITIIFELISSGLIKKINEDNNVKNGNRTIKPFNPS
tara:strand:+ start:3237 stop:3428 length:192 start_codon:yes stop_codon:yes gene_type:complete